ncbi:MAG: hypothetical protein AAFR51_10220 [Pseudomonadota bacterium]
MRPTQPLFLFAAIAQFFVPVLPQLGIGQSVGDRATALGIPPELPLGVFFSIWGVIFTGLVLIAILNLRAPDHTSERLAQPLMLASIGNIIWMLSAQSIGSVWLDFLLLLPIAFYTWEAAYRWDRTSKYDGTLRSMLYAITTGLFAGWLTVAVSISVPDVARAALDRGVTDAVWQSLWLTLIPVAALAYVFASHVSRSIWFVVALGWGLLGIIINNWTRTEMHALAIAATLVGLYILQRRIRYGASGSYPDTF